MNQAERRDSKKAELNMYNVKIELNNEQVERERMTPAFNARQSYVYKKEE